MMKVDISSLNFVLNFEMFETFEIDENSKI